MKHGQSTYSLNSKGNQSDFQIPSWTFLIGAPMGDDSNESHITHNFIDQWLLAKWIDWVNAYCDLAIKTLSKFEKNSYFSDRLKVYRSWYNKAADLTCDFTDEISRQLHLDNFSCGTLIASNEWRRPQIYIDKLMARYSKIHFKGEYHKIIERDVIKVHSLCSIRLSYNNMKSIAGRFQYAIMFDMLHSSSYLGIWNANDVPDVIAEAQKEAFDHA